MNKRLISIIRKEFIHILRDPRSLMITILMPLLMIILFGNAVQLDIKEIKFGVIDQSNTQKSRELINNFIYSGYFTRMDIPQKRSEIDNLFKQREIKAVLIIPTDFATSLKTKSQTKVQMIVDGSNSNTASVVINYTKMIIQTFSAKLNIQIMNSPISIQPRVWYNPEMESVNFVLPGLIAVILMMISALLTSVTIAREKETGTMEQILVSPINPLEIVLGKVVPYVLIAFFDGALVVIAARYIFAVPINGSILLLALMSFFYLYACLSLGVFISTKANSQLIAMMVALVITMLPSILLSGFIFPIKSMPYVLRLITYIVPARYFLIIIRGIIMKGIGIQYLYVQVLFLFLLGTFLLILSTKNFKQNWIK